MIKRKAQYFLRALFGISIWKRNRFNESHSLKRILIALPWYALTLIFSLLDFLFIGSILSGVFRITCRTQRRLTEDELERLSLVVRDVEYLKRIAIFENSWLSKMGAWLNRSQDLGLGVADTVHFSRRVNTQMENDMAWLIHEVAHTLQYKYRGLVYIPEALIAQQFSGYSFGGLQTIRENIPLQAFNPEQQADIFKTIVLTNEMCSLRQEIKKGNW